MAFSAVLDLTSFNKAQGFTIAGPYGNAQLGQSAAPAGDVNGDGIDDLIIGGPPGQGRAWVVYGTAAGLPFSLDLNTLDGTNGYAIAGEENGDNLGFSVSSAGDINNDGFDDVIVGARLFGSNDFGAAYVIYGAATQSSLIFVPQLTGTDGFRLTGQGANANTGRAVASAGDINNDGFDDFLVSSPFHTSTATQSGSVYVVFGKGGAFAASTDLSTLNGTNGFRISGEQVSDFAGWSVASAGDVNNDGFDDILVGASQANATGSPNAGGVYLIYGKASGYVSNLPLSGLNGADGTQFFGFSELRAGFSVSGAGDINGDGFDDMVIGAPGSGFNSEPGRVFVVFGRSGGYGANFNLSGLIESQGFVIVGENAGDFVGASVSLAGDFNGDGYDDLLIGAQYADASGAGSSASYLVFGQAGGFTARLDLSTLDGSNGFQINPPAGNGLDSKVAAAGDLNDDGYDDIVVTLPRNDNGQGAGLTPGLTYVIYGGLTLSSNVITGSAANQTLSGGALSDDIAGLAGADKLNGMDGDDVLDGGDGADRLSGGLGADTLRGGGGNDYLDGGLGNDVMAGGADNDVYIVDQAGDTVIEGIDAGYDVVRASIDYVLTANVEGLELMGTGDINGTGNNLGNRITGNVGDNTLTGGAGVDTLLGGDGDDILIGGGEGDRLTGGAGADTFVMTNGSLGGVLETDTILDLIAAEGDIIDPATSTPTRAWRATRPSPWSRPSPSRPAS